MKRLIIDLDNTLTLGEAGDYADADPRQEVVQRLRGYKSRGFDIVIHTSRNMRTYQGNIGKIIANTSPVIIDWLVRHNIPFDEIWVGKPWCGHQGFYVDDKAIRPDEFANMSYDEIASLLNLHPED